MSKGEEDNLELQINRYLDGEIRDDEFEQYLADRPENIDIERFRAFKSRVERIEELYRQIEEPAVPDGYWESFAERVAEKLPAEAPAPLADRLLNCILPWRWPTAAYGYAGAVASVLLIFFIGKTVQQSGRDSFAPRPVESVSKKGDLFRERGDTAGWIDRSTVSEPSPEADAREFEDISDATPPPFVGERVSVDEASPVLIEKTEKPAYGDEHPVSEQEPLEKQRPAVTVDQSEQKSEPQVIARKEAVTMPEVVESVTEIGIPLPAKKSDAISLSLGETEQIGPVPSEERAAVGRSGVSTDIMSLTKPASNVVVTLNGSDNRVEEYDSRDLEDLRNRLKLYDSILVDSSYASYSFVEYVKMKSSVAIITRDSTDIYDAVAVIDTLLQYNPGVDKGLWLQRRSSIRSILSESAEP